MTEKTVIVATANSAQRQKVAALIDGMPDFKVIARTADLMNTYNQVEARVPSAVLISDSLANLAEFEVMRALFSTLEVRWLVLTAPDKSHRTASSNTPASDLFSVPGNAEASIIEGQLRSLTRSKLHRASPLPPEGTRAGLAKAGPPKLATAETVTAARRGSPTPPAQGSDSFILIGASTGGVDALLSVLSCFPEDCPPTMIVQHTGAGFGESLAALLNRQCAATVMLAGQSQTLRRGTILLGAGTRAHLMLKTGTPPSAVCIPGTHVSGHMPSVDKLFKSAVAMAPRITAAILTGMGKDGAEGLLALRNAGATTYAQDEASCVIFGMPRAAVEIGAAQMTLPIDKIGPALLRGPKNQRRHQRQVFL